MSEIHNITYGKNLIINGSFLVSQRQATTYTSPSSGDYNLDMFSFSETGATVVTISRETSDQPTLGQSGVSQTACAALKVDVTLQDDSVAAGDFAVIAHSMEGHRYSALRGKYGTLSFWVKSPKTGIHCVAFRNSGVDRSYIAEYTVDSADTWEKKSVTVLFNEDGGTWDYTNGVGLRVVWTLMCGSTKQTTKDAWQSGNYLATSNQVNCVDHTDNNFFICQAQLEVGHRATAFETRDFGTELAMCQRYFETSYSHGTSVGTGTAAGAHHTKNDGSSGAVATLQTTFTVRKRTVPTITWYSTDSGTIDKVYNSSTPADVTVTNETGEGHGTTGYPSMAAQNDLSFLKGQWTADASL